MEARTLDKIVRAAGAVVAAGALAVLVWRVHQRLSAGSAVAVPDAARDDTPGVYTRQDGDDYYLGVADHRYKMRRLCPLRADGPTELYYAGLRLAADDADRVYDSAPWTSDESDPFTRQRWVWDPVQRLRKVSVDYLNENFRYCEDAVPDAGQTGVR